MWQSQNYIMHVHASRKKSLPQYQNLMTTCALCEDTKAMKSRTLVLKIELIAVILKNENKSVTCWVITKHNWIESLSRYT